MNKWYAAIVLCVIALAALAVILIPIETACDNLYKQRAMKFEVEGFFYGHGEGRIDPAIKERCWDTSFGVDGKVYYASGRWKGDFPETGTQVHITSPTGLAWDVIITDVETGKKYISGYKQIITPQP